jgi:AcrR family transcriptional regulator
MSQLPVKDKNKHQTRTEKTQSKLLHAAEVIFAKRGVEKTKLEEVAAQAGYTRGAIYAHYSGKDDLFLALMRCRSLKNFMALRQMIEAEPETSKRIGIFKLWIVSQVCEHSWSTLMLEFKLYAARRPHSREKLIHMYDPLAKCCGSDFIELLFGDDLDSAARATIERRLAIMGAILSAVILESAARPKLLLELHLRPILEELFDTVIHP